MIVDIFSVTDTHTHSALFQVLIMSGNSVHDCTQVWIDERLALVGKPNLEYCIALISRSMFGTHVIHSTMTQLTDAREHTQRAHAAHTL